MALLAFLFIYLKDTPTDGTTTTAIQLQHGGLRAHQRGFEGSSLRTGHYITPPWMDGWNLLETTTAPVQLGQHLQMKSQAVT